MDKSQISEQAYRSKTGDEETKRVAAAQKNPQAFGALYDQYAPAIYRYLLSRLGNIDDARDVTSQTFLKAVEMFPRYKHRGYFSAWLFSIARSKYVDYLRQRKREAESFREDPVDPQPNPMVKVVVSERAAELKKCIHALTPIEQELLRLRYVANLSYGEMAELLNKNEDAVKKRIYRLLARLKNQMEDFNASESNQYS